MRQAELDLEFTELRAPVAGRIGDRRVSPGNLVTGGAAGTTRCSPPSSRSTRSASSSRWMRRRICATSALPGSGKEVTGPRRRRLVGLKLLDEKDFDHRGHMDFVDNVIDQASGTIRGRAVFANPDGVLDARHVRAHPRAGLAGLQRAAGAGRRDRHRAGAQVRAGGRRRQHARRRNTSRSGRWPDDLRVIKDGIEPDDRVIVNGLMRARPGEKVTPQEQGADAAGSPRRSRTAG